MPALSYITRDAAERLASEGSITIYFPHNLIPEIRAGWQGLLKESREYKNQWSFDPAEENAREIGYFVRDGTTRREGGAPDDFKEFFHFYQDLPELLARRGVPYASYGMWLEVMEEFRKQCARTTLAVAVGLDRLRGSDFAARLRESADVGLIRLLSYDIAAIRAAGRTLIGKGHTDGSYITLHLWDEYSCLFLGQGEARTRHQSRRNTALVFFGDQAERKTGGALQAMYHEISDDPVLVPQDALTREAIIYFADIKP